MRHSAFQDVPLPTRRPRPVGGRDAVQAGAPEGAGPENSLLLAQFRAFVAEMLALRDRLEASSSQLPSSPAVPAAAQKPDDPVEARQAEARSLIEAKQAEAAAIVEAEHRKIFGAPAPVRDASVPVANAPHVPPEVAMVRDEGRKRLLGMLDRQGTQGTAQGGYLGTGMLHEAQYVMTALADEVMLSARWTGRRSWQLLEEERFQQHEAGDLFYTKLDALLHEAHGGSVELAMIFFQALALGFRGRYRVRDEKGAVERYKRQLYLRIFQVPPDDVPTGAITPRAYDVTTPEGEVRLSDPRRWYLLPVGVALLWLVVSTLLWFAVTGGVAKQVDRIQHYNNTGLHP